MISRSGYALVVQIWIQCLIVEGSFHECNLERPCAMGNISQEFCERRNCCYSRRLDSLNTCFAKRISQEKPSVVRPPPPPSDIFPDDAVTLPEEIRKGMVEIQNQTQTEAIQLVNKFEDHMKNISMTSEINWEFEWPEIIRVNVKVEPSTFLKQVKFRSGSTVRLTQIWGISSNGTKRNISTVIATEYPRLIEVFVKEQERDCQLKKDKVYLKDSPIISVKAFDQDWNVLSIPVVFTMHELNTTSLATQKNATLSCTFLNEDITEHDWFKDGCTLQSYDNSSVQCFCNHTTKFSTLFVIEPLTFQLQKDHRYNINILEYSMESLSLLCLIVTLFVLTLVQRRRSKGSSISGMRAGERTAVHANFVSSLSLLHLTRLLSEVATRNEVACTLIAILSGMWMLIEGVLLYLNVILRSMKNTALGIHKYWVGWGLPAIVVIVSAAVGLTQKENIQEQKDECIEDGVRYTSIIPEEYYQEAFCWLSYSRYMIWSAVGPLIVIFSFNIFILAHTVVFVWRLNRKTGKMMPSNHRNDTKHFWKTAKSILVLFPILGVPWLIGFLINTQNKTVNLTFQYIHVVLNGLQGFFIFLLYCVINRESRGIVSRVASSRWEQHKVSISASNTMGRSTSGSRRKGQRKSVSSQMGGSEQNAYGTPINMTRMGSQYSVYTSSMNRKQSSGSGSTSLSGCAHRINRMNPSISDFTSYRQKTGYYMKAGSSHSLPHMSRNTQHKYLTRSGSVSALGVIDRDHYHHSNTLEREICRTQSFTHVTNIIAGLGELHDSNDKAKLLSYKLTSSLDNIATPPPAISEIYQQNRKLKRMTEEEFKRFSAIPEEKRRSGINSFISAGSSEHLSNRVSIFSSLKDDIIELNDMHKTITSVTVEESAKNLQEEYSLVNGIASQDHSPTDIGITTESTATEDFALSNKDDSPKHEFKSPKGKNIKTQKCNGSYNVQQMEKIHGVSKDLVRG